VSPALTMPLTTGPGTITVAVSLGANRPHTIGEGRILSFLFCIGIQIFWNGAAELLASLPR
jgi:small neutral amino acid transporter SnatA (MarC family)